MAIFGNLNHMSLSDLLPFLSSQQGALEIFNLERHPGVTMYFNEGMLTCLYLGNKEADALLARSIVGEILGARKGAFEFLPQARPRRCSQLLNMRVDRLLVSVTTTQDEFAQVREQLPHPKTVFKIAGQTAPQDSRISDFWQKARSHLQAGASSEQLAGDLGMPLDHVRFYLHRLRQLRAVEPVRARPKTVPASGSAASRLLGALKRRFFGTDKGRVWSH